MLKKTHMVTEELSSLHHLPCGLVAPEDLVLQRLPVEENKKKPSKNKLVIFQEQR